MKKCLGACEASAKRDGLATAPRVPAAPVRMCGTAAGLQGVRLTVRSSVPNGRAGTQQHIARLLSSRARSRCPLSCTAQFPRFRDSLTRRSTRSRREPAPTPRQSGCSATSIPPYVSNLEGARGSPAEAGLTLSGRVDSSTPTGTPNLTAGISATNRRSLGRDGAPGFEGIEPGGIRDDALIPQRRLMLELARNFVAIPVQRHQDGTCRWCALAEPDARPGASGRG